MSDHGISPVSRRTLLGEAALATAAAAVAMVAVPNPAQAAGSSPARPKDDRPRLPLRILTRNRMDDELLAQIRAISPQITVLASDRFAEELPTADVVIGKVLPEEFAGAKQLRWVQVTSGGVDAILTPQFAASDVMLTNVSGSYGAPIAETAIAFMLALTRGVGFQSYNRKWDGFDVRQVELRGLTMGIIGLGGIGREVARRAKALDMHVIAVDAEPMVRERYQMADELWLVDTHLEELLKRSDVLVCCVPLTRRTHRMLGERQFALMKDGSYVVNVTRGKIVDTDALVAALKSKKLAGAGLDVTDPEPLPADHPLWKEPNVFITPHKAGGSPLTGKREEAIFVENIRRYVAGLPMLNVVDKQKGY
jgi:phosphoglycerate dehydrogenase-like enzyme